MIRFTLPDKTAREEDVYTIDWKPHLGADTLTGAVPAALNTLEGTVTVDQGTNNIADGMTSFWIRGGASGEVAVVRVGITTVGGKELDALCTIGVRY